MQITKWAGISKATPELLGAIVRGATDRGWDADALIGHIASESGFNPAAKAPGESSTASGLGQIIESTMRIMLDAPVRKRGEPASYTTALRRLTAMEQLPFVFGFFERFGKGRKLTGADFKLIGFGVSPSNPDTKIIGSKNDQGILRTIYDQNSAFDVNGDGIITIGDVRAWWAKTEAAARAKGEIEVDPGDPVTVPADLSSLLFSKFGGGSGSGFFSRC